MRSYGENEVLCTVSPGPEPALQDLSSLTMKNIGLLYGTTTQTHTTRRVQAASCSNQPALHSFHSFTTPETSCESSVCLVVLQSGKYQWLVCILHVFLRLWLLYFIFGVICCDWGEQTEASGNDFSLSFFFSVMSCIDTIILCIYTLRKKIYSFPPISS